MVAPINRLGQTNIGEGPALDVFSPSAGPRGRKGLPQNLGRFATGIGKSFQPALLLQALARKARIFVHDCPSDMLHEAADHMGENDLIIVFSVSARGEIMERIRGRQGKVMLVTTNTAHAYQDVVDRTVVLPFLPPDPETCPVSPVLMDVFVELLVSYIINALTEE